MSQLGLSPEPQSRSRSQLGVTTRRLLATDHVILNHGQVTWTTPELAPLLTTTPHQREDVSALDRFNVHRCPTRTTSIAVHKTTQQIPESRPCVDGQSSPIVPAMGFGKSVMDQSGMLAGLLVQKTQYSDNLVALHFKYDFWHRTATAGSDVVKSGRPIFDDFFQHLWPYIGNNTANVVLQMVKRLWLIRIDQ
ncbi:adhesion G protein-coupled receptor B2 [Trichonephila clavipes]|uniref:Adhesion G protein-coupled receptor B2 n=1 Tax=Trichonephila clavipes TaxID=2585209 RepID=A0A8X6S3H8_TRICX|nr:adhesion G protein-coupled receptor B2 [Trichonephila clavipes]